MYEELVIKISATEQGDGGRGGYMIDVYESESDLSDGNDPIDGAICTGSMLDAVDLARTICFDLVRARFEKIRTEKKA